MRKIVNKFIRYMLFYPIMFVFTNFNNLQKHSVIEKVIKRNNLIIKNWIIIRKLRNFINLISDDSEIEMTDIKLMYRNIKNPAIKSHLLRNEIEKSDDETENDMDIITL